jgi:hypothetical protein
LEGAGVGLAVLFYLAARYFNKLILPMFSGVLRLLLCAIFLCCFTNAQAQDVWGKTNQKTANARKKVDKGKSKLKQWKEHLERNGLDPSLKYQLAIGGRLNSNGWSGNIQYLKRINKVQSHLWQISFSEIRHEKQIKQNRAQPAYAYLGKPTQFTYGKINNVYVLQIGYGRERLVLPGIVEDNLSVSFRYNAGLSLALLKPYYLRLIDIDRTDPNDKGILVEKKFSSSNSELFLNDQYIMGASKWDKGLDETKLTPGLYAEAAFAIEPGKNKFFVQTITLGANISYYTKALPIMAELKATTLQTCVFAGLNLGKRWK